LYYARFHGLDDLNNASTNTQFPLGRPGWRFGHHTSWGRSRELDRFDAAPNFFVGRLTHEETSSSNIHYPHGFLGGVNPISANYVAGPTGVGTVGLDTNDDGTLDVTLTGPRRAEDLLMPNVHSFDIKVWDDLANRFVDIGGSDAVYYSQLYRSSTGGETYGPSRNNTFNNVFDTWHPDVDLDLDNDGTVAADEQDLQPPFRVRLYRPTSGNDHPSVVNDTSPTNFPMTVNGSISREMGPWQANSPVTIGTLRFPTVAGLQASTRFYYRMVGTATMATGPNYMTDATEPPWPNFAGARVVDNECVWEAVDNWRPLKAIQITVRFFDIPRDQMRQMTIVHNLVD
jgi:hypothetical protein